MKKKVPLVSKRKAEAITIQRKKEMDKFFKNHWLSSNDILTIILKTHLYIEICMDSLFVKLLPKPQKILKKRFADKIDLFEALALNYPPDEKGLFIEKLRAINRIRNSFAHDLNKDLSLEDIKPLLKNLRINSNTSKITRLKVGLQHLIGYLHFMKIFNETFPFAASCMRNEKNFKRDKGYPDKLHEIYPLTMLKKSLEWFRMK